MSDPWVTNAQTWINTTYGHIPAIGTVPTDGKTGWPIMYALTRALQRELGITALSDTFGETTLGMLGAMPPIGATPPAGGETSAAVKKYRRIVKIVQAAMYCKGYNGGDGEINGVWSTTTTAGIIKLRGEMGISTTNKDVSPKVFKALLNMDAYVLVSGGSATIRTIQRELNSRYAGGRKDFYIIPTDGFYSRDVQRGMMYAIQYELGMNDSTANGNFGPGTKQGLSDHANFGVNGTGFLVKLYQAALIFNGFTTLYSTTFTNNTAAVTRKFQAFCKLDVTGRSDLRTWASLLVSTGDVDRPGTACDTIREITPARADTLVARGYRTVGRYLTNTPNVVDPLDKNIKPNELANIFAAGMSVFPIFQEGGTGTPYFNYDAGFTAGYRAHEAAVSYGFKAGTTIYFAVDFDALEHEVYDHVVPYFEGVNAGIEHYGDRYKIGIYGSRNTCSIVSSQGLATLSFVSGMSTGFSGNLGYPLPANWAFDQILEYEEGSGDGWVNIDKNIQSGRDQGQTSVAVPPTSLTLDVNLPAGSSSPFKTTLAERISTELTDAQKLIAIRTRQQVADHVAAADTLVTNLSREFKMRKSLIQTVFAWEAACLNPTDLAADDIVTKSHAWRLRTGAQPSVLKYDSSTGLCQIFAETAIRAINWARQRGMTGEPVRDPDNLNHIFEIWNRLRTDSNFNLRSAALTLAHGAYENGLTGSLLTLDDAQVEVALASYNDAGYGVKVARIYRAIEVYNKQARGN